VSNCSDIRRRRRGWSSESRPGRGGRNDSGRRRHGGNSAEAGFAGFECGLGFGVLIQVAENEAVAEGIGDAHVAAPGLFDDAGARVFIFFGEELLLIGVKAFDFDAQRGAGTGVTMMFGNVQDAIVFGNLHVERSICFEAMLPIHIEAEEGDVEFLGFGLIKAANYRNWMGEFHRGSLACGGKTQDKSKSWRNEIGRYIKQKVKSKAGGMKSAAT
jgi:hypothetical protein